MILRGDLKNENFCLKYIFNAADRLLTTIFCFYTKKIVSLKERKNENGSP